MGTVPWLSIGLTAAFAMVMVMGGGFGGGISGNLIWFFTPLLLASGTLEYALSATGISPGPEDLAGRPDRVLRRVGRST